VWDARENVICGERGMRKTVGEGGMGMTEHRMAAENENREGGMRMAEHRMAAENENRLCGVG
jgi:hypothetical protein